MFFEDQSHVANETITTAHQQRDSMVPEMLAQLQQRSVLINQHIEIE